MLALIDAPVQAEYWVNEMILVKKELTKPYTDRRKIFIAGGSSTLFGIDAEQASKQLDMPVINFGLHAGLRLEKILDEVKSVISHDDYLILHLEPPYYECPKELNSWQIRNMIAWDHESWRDLNRLEKIKLFFSISPVLYQDMLISGLKREFYPLAVADRTAALDQAVVLAKYRSQTRPKSSFSYSAYQLNRFGDIQAAKGSIFRGRGRDVRKPIHVCESTESELSRFVEEMARKRVHVYFSNTPNIDQNVDKNEIDRIEVNFRKELSAIGCLIDQRKDMLFERHYFFDTNLHLNVKGRQIRTNLLIDAIRNHVLTGQCD